MSISWQDENPPVITAKIWTPPAGLTEVCLLGRWLGVWVHWMGRRTLPCLGDECPKARHNRPIRWIGYAPITVPRQKALEAAILALSPEKAEELTEYMGDGLGPVIFCKRNQKSREWHIDHVNTEVKPDARFPITPDVRYVLFRLWGIRPDSQSNGKEG